MNIRFRGHFLANEEPGHMSGTIGGNLGDLHDVSVCEVEPGLFEVSGRLKSSHRILDEDDLEEGAAYLIDDILFDHSHALCDEIIQIHWGRDYHISKEDA